MCVGVYVCVNGWDSCITQVVSEAVNNMAFMDGLRHRVSEQLILPLSIWPKSTFYHSRNSLSNSQVQVPHKHFGGIWTSWPRWLVTREGSKRWPGKREKCKAPIPTPKGELNPRPCPSVKSLYPTPSHTARNPRNLESAMMGNVLPCCHKASTLI